MRGTRCVGCRSEGLTWAESCPLPGAHHRTEGETEARGDQAHQHVV
jgi:hypothetical protein